MPKWMIGKKAGDSVYLTKCNTPWGIGRLFWDDQGLIELKLTDISVWIGGDQSIEKLKDSFDAVKQLQYYFQKRLTRFSLPINYHGTFFDKEVWKGLTCIPYGEKWSYYQLAEFIGHPKAARAVGNANRRNPLPIIVPCHRVIRSDGSLGGYGSGINIKKDLLELESYPPGREI